MKNQSVSIKQIPDKDGSVLSENVDKGALEALIWLKEFLAFFYKDYKRVKVSGFQFEIDRSIPLATPFEEQKDEASMSE